MAQINFRVTEDIRKLIDILAKERGESVAEFAKQAILKEISTSRQNLALNLLAEGKIRKKEAFKLSGLSYHEFLIELSKRKIVENIPDEIIDEAFEDILKLDISNYMRTREENIQ